MVKGIQTAKTGNIPTKTTLDPLEDQNVYVFNVVSFRLRFILLFRVNT